MPTVSAGLVAGLADYAVARGADRAVLMAQAGFVADDLVDQDRRLPLRHYPDLLHLAAGMVGDPALALHFGRDVAMAEMSIVGLIMEASATMMEAFTQLQRYGRLVLDAGGASAGPPGLELVHESGRLYLVERRADADRSPELTDVTFAHLACGPRRFLVQPHVLGVELARPEPPHAAAYAAVFRCPVRFGAQWNALELHPEVGGWRVAQNPRYVFGVLTERAEALLTEQATAGSMRAHVEALLLPVLHQGPIGVEGIAAQLGLSRTTLFRRLKSEGTSFAAVLDDVRHSLALHYLGGGKVSVNESAYLLGFSDAAAFSRAFRRWTGRPPGAYRRGKTPKI